MFTRVGGVRIVLTGFCTPGPRTQHFVYYIQIQVELLLSDFTYVQIAGPVAWSTQCTEIM